MTRPGYTPGTWRNVCKCPACGCVHPDLDHVCARCGTLTYMSPGRPHRPTLTTRLLGLFTGRRVFTTWEVRK